MENLHTNKLKKKKDKKPIYILLGFISFFILFIYFLTRPSLQSTAIDQINICSNTNDVKSVFDRYKFELLENDEFGNKIVSIDFQYAVRSKLNSFNLNDHEINECLKWLPPSKINLNIIVIPDLSRRIIDNANNPNQINNDILILSTIWKTFVEYSKLKQDSKDKLIIDVTDVEQAHGQFDKVADKLQFDLANHKGKSNRLFFTEEKDKLFHSSIKELYQLAKQKPLGADYKFYLRRYLSNHLKKATLFENYANKVIIITDGYLEPENSQADTKILGYEDILRQSVITGNTLNVITLNNLNIPKVNIDLSNTEVMICEVNERKIGRGYDFEILKTYWEDWFSRMNVKNKITFLQREQSNAITTKRVDEFILNTK